MRMRFRLVLASAMLATLVLAATATAVDVPVCFAADAAPSGTTAGASGGACLEDSEGTPATAQTFTSGTIKVGAATAEPAEPVACAQTALPSPAGPGVTVDACAGQNFGGGVVKVSK
jgi:hypothetical protein